MNCRQTLLSLPTALSCLLMITGIAIAQDLESERVTLKGLSGVGVLLADLAAETERDGLTKAAIQTDVELKLRLAGIRVLTVEQVWRTPGSPYLYVNVLCGKRERLYACHISLDLVQDVSLVRAPSTTAIAQTWGVGALETMDALQLLSVRETVKDMVDIFINAWLSVNPKE